MKSAKFLHEFSKQFADALPPPLNSLRQEFEKQFYHGLCQVFEKMKLVTREEFDIQTELLARTRSKVEQLERKLDWLEKNSEG